MKLIVSALIALTATAAFAAEPATGGAAAVPGSTHTMAKTKKEAKKECKEKGMKGKELKKCITETMKM